MINIIVYQFRKRTMALSRIPINQYFSGEHLFLFLFETEESGMESAGDTTLMR